jgi:hypothetical protein
MGWWGDETVVLKKKVEKKMRGVLCVYEKKGNYNLREDKRERERGWG